MRELVEDKDRTKEIPDAIAQGHLSYGMQTFDQSLMSLLKANVITYEEALRQATNPDDFALRVSGISGTSDSKWDSFEKPPEPGPRPGAPAAPPQARGMAPAGRMTPAKGIPPAKPPAPKPGGGGGSSGAGGDDDFQIERF